MSTYLSVHFLELENPTNQHQNVNLNNVYKLYTFLIMIQIGPDSQSLNP